MGRKRSSFSEVKNQSVNLRKHEKPEQQNGIARNTSGRCNCSVDDFQSANAEFPQHAGDTDPFEVNEKASQWFGTGELEVVRPETHPEAFVPVAPDGGWSWMVLLGSFSCSIIIDGITFSVGLLLADLADRFKTTKAKVALVGSLFLGCYQVIGPIVAALINRFGCRALAITGSLLASMAMFASSFATNMDFLLCTFGVFAGSSFGLIHLPAMICVNFYFNRRRAMANGVAVVGTPVGAVIFGPLTSYLLRVYHWSNTLIIFAGLLLHCVAFACLYRPLLPAVRLSGVHAHSVPDGLDDLIAEELDTRFFASNGYLRSIATFASNNPIVPPLVRVDEPDEKEALLRYNEEQSCVEQTDDAAVDGSAKWKSGIYHAGQNEIRIELSASSLDHDAHRTSHPNKLNLSAPNLPPTYSVDTDAQIKESKENMQKEDEQFNRTSEPSPPVCDRELSEKCLPPSENFDADGQAQSAMEKTVMQAKQAVEIPSIQTPASPEIKFERFRRSSNVSCILSTPCLGGYQMEQDRLSGIFRRLTHEHYKSRFLHPIRHRTIGRYREYSRLRRQQDVVLAYNGDVGLKRRSSSSRTRRHLSGIPTIEEGQVLEHIPPNLTNPTGRELISNPVLDGGREYSSAITLNGLSRDYSKRPRGSPSVKSGLSIHQSALSGLATAPNTVKVELARINDKPAVVMLPHPDVSIKDYSRPMYRSDIFYSGNVAPELGLTTQASELSARPQGLESQMRISELISSAFSLRPENISRRMSSARPEATSGVAPSTDLETGTFLSQPNWYESYLVSLTRIPVDPVDYEEHPGSAVGYIWCCSPGLSGCGTRAGVIGADVDRDTDSMQPMSLCECCITCIRRLRDGRLPLKLHRSKNELSRTKSNPLLSADKFEAAGDFISDVGTEHQNPRCLAFHLRICTSKAFTDVLSSMTDLQLFRNKGYRFAFVANFFAVLGTYVPLIYVTEFAVRNGIPEHMCSYLISIMGLVNIIGRLAFAWLSALLGIRPIVIQTITQFLLGSLIALLPLFVSFVTQAIAFGLMGLLSGPFASLSTIILCDLVGVDALTTAVGLVTLSRGLSSALGAPLAGLLYEWTGDFTVPYVVSGMTIVLSGVLFGVIICLRKDPLEKLEEI